mmetsp:Transcript_67073/g.149655  ORF Transcript_67073/g.149655 Transcript_67073/m.149655 type:complete len:207 (-) Transcript_67073:10-630(-)
MVIWRLSLCDGFVQASGSVQGGGVWRTRHELGRLRFLLHRKVHVVAARERKRVRRRLRDDTCASHGGEADAGTWHGRRECALSAHSAAHHGAHAGEEGIRIAAVPRRTPLASLRLGPCLHGATHRDLLPPPSLMWCSTVWCGAQRGWPGACSLVCIRCPATSQLVPLPAVARCVGVGGKPERGGTKNCSTSTQTSRVQLQRFHRET